MRTALIALILSLASPVAADPPQPQSKMAKARERAAKSAARRADKAQRVQERCEVALYEACVLREEARLGHDQDALACEPVRADGKGGSTDYSVCRTTP